MAYVAVFIPGLPSQRIELRESNMFGRSSSCGVWIDEPNVSRQHCKLQQDGAKWVLIDLDSTNGTWLDAARVRRYVIRDGETFYIGDARIVFHADQRVENRPADPNEASHFAQMLPHEDTNADTIVCARAGRPLPAARATIAGSGKARHPANSIAFRRPPARPIIKDDHSGGWVGSLVARLRGQQ